MTRTTLFRNGRFWIDHDRFQTSISVRGGKIVNIGVDNGDHDSVIDLHQALVLPAFVDAHCHLLMLGESLAKVDLQGSTCLSDILARLKSFHEQNPNAKRIYAKNWIQNMTKPTEVDRRSIDVFDKPVILESYDLHSGLLNSAALREVGINDDTVPPVGGELVRDHTGRLTGWLKEMAYMQLFVSKIRETTTHADKQAAISKAFHALIDAGYTGVGDLLMEEDVFAILEEMVEKDERLPLRVRCYWHCPPNTDISESFKHIERAKKLQNKWAGNEWLCINGIKIVSDGVIDACTAALLLPYQDGTTVEPLWPLDHLKAAVHRADQLGLQCAIHAIGDLAVQNAVTAYEILGATRIRHLRHRIEHLELSTAEDASRIGELGITTSVQPVHSDPALLSNWYDQLGGKSSPRCCRAFAYRDFLEAGAMVAIGTDAPTAPHAPLPNLHLATKRTSAADPSLEETVAPQHALDLAAAIGAATHGAALACHLDEWQGSFETGKSADFNVLDTDVFQKEETDSHLLLKAKVVRTYKQGELVAHYLH